MKLLTKVAVLYVIFALAAIIFNLGTQFIIVLIYTNTYVVEWSILAGTGVGLLIKYMLDKRFIFVYKAKGLAHDGKLFFLYSVMGFFTTILFWGVEYTFHWIYGTDTMRYLGGAIGLSLGYLTKYHLDKRFVFVPSTLGYTVSR